MTTKQHRKLPHRTAETISDRPAVVPSIPEHSLRGLPIPFMGDEVTKIAQCANLTLLPNANLNWLSANLQLAVFQFLLSHGSAAKNPSPSELRLWLKSVERDATSLMNRLGLTAAEWAEFNEANPSAFRSAREHLKGGIFEETHSQHAPLVPSDVRRVLGNKRFVEAVEQAVRAAEAAESDGTIEHQLQAEFQEAAYCLLDLAPRVLGLLVALARSAANKRLSRSKPSGRRPEEARRYLFRDLAAIHLRVCGVTPRTRNKVGQREPRSPAVQWVRGMVNHVIERLNDRKDPDSVEGARLFRDISKLSDDRLADLLEAGSAAVKRGFRENRQPSG